MILAPFKWIVALFFSWSYALFHDPGWAVVGMSVLLSLLLTPLYIWIERRKNADKAKGAPMQAEIDKIEAVYTGRERFYYTREIQRRYGYSPWTAMIPTLGLLVQIPFLLAAYHYLSELPVFNGAAFWYIRDLSKPDTIATVAGLPINLLAILMTAINLVSGWRYAESGKPKERIQYMAVAAIFLFLLYGCAASVVLYWTLSNALSFVRSEIFFQKKGAPERKPGCDFSWICSRRFLSAVWFAMVFVACYCLGIGFAIKGSSEALRQLVLSMDKCGVCFMLFAWVILLVAAAVMRRADAPRASALDSCRSLQKWAMAFFLVLFFFDTFTDCPIASVPILKWFADRAWPIVGICAVLGFILSAGVLRRMLDEVLSFFAVERVMLLTSLCATLYVAGVILIWHPLLVYSSEPQSFSVTAWQIVSGGVWRCLVVAILHVLLWRFCLKGNLAWSMFTALCVGVAVMVFIYLFLLPVDIGTLQGRELVNAEGMIRRPFAYVMEAVGLCAVAVTVVVCIRKVSWLKITGVIVLLHMVVMAQAVFKGIRAEMVSPEEVATESASQENAEIKLSKTQKNIVVFMLDMVQGQSFTNVFSNPKLASGLEGFIWYPNAVSIANMTCPSMPALYGGYAYSPSKLNEDTGRILNDKATDVMRGLRDAFRNKSFDFVHYNCNDAVFINELTRVSPLYDKQYLSSVMGKACYGGFGDERSVLYCNALLQACPFLVKPCIYNGGKWRGCGTVSDSYKSFSDEHMLYEALPKLTKFKEGESGAFNFFHVEATHNPWGVPTDDGRFVKANNVEILEWVMVRLNAYFQWMKDNGVYDNTRIVLVSDHGLVNMSKKEHNPETDPIKNRHLWQKLMAGAIDHWMLQEQKIQMLNCLLVVKDYGDRAKLKCDDRLMSNADLREILECESVSAAVSLMPNEREAFVVIPPVDGSGFQWHKKMEIILHFIIKNNVFDLANWERVK